MTKQKNIFEVGKTYYYPIEDWRLKYIEEEPGGLSIATPQYTFKILDTTEEGWDEFTTAKPEEIWKTKAEYLKSLKREKPVISNV